MAVPGYITISNPQQRVKDSYASAPKIDLTVRANGEEKVMVMDAQGRWNIAGFDAPTVAAGVTTSATAGGFTANKYWAYTYVYVAKLNYPLVENAQTGGGSLAPRTNPAPFSPANSTVNTKQKILDIPTSQRSDLSHIWIYRTLADFDDAETAEVNAEAGVMFWIGEVENNANLPSVPFTDTGIDTDGLEQIENDNFTAPIFDKVVYADPYFWGFGNSIWYYPVIVDATGLVTSTPDGTGLAHKWYDGRDGQTISFDGISSGGYDNRGNFYFKSIDNYTAQLYSDIALTNPVGVTKIGSTKALIRGASTVLYRSKPRNPFAWGSTDLIGDVQVPSVYAFSVGGGEGTGLAIIANQNLLKLDTEKPTKCYTLNLKNAGTPNFEPSLRIISDTFSVSHSAAQFTAVLERGQTVLRSLDMKSFAIIDCDGASQVPITNPVSLSLRYASGNCEPNDPSKKSSLPHGVYAPRYELNCLFLLGTQAELNGINPLSKVIIQHAPTGYWSSLDLFDVSCSAQVYDELTSSTKVFVGTTTGFVGEMFERSKYNHWYTGGNSDAFPTAGHKGFGPCSIDAFGHLIVDRGSFIISGTTPRPGLIGNWVTLLHTDISGVLVRSLLRIGSVVDSHTLAFDLGGYPIEGNITEWAFGGMSFLPPGDDYTFYIGLIPIEIGRSFNGQIPFDYKKLEEFHTAWRGSSVPAYPPTVQFYGTFLPYFSSGSHELAMVASNNSEGALPSDGNYAMLTDIPVDIAKSFAIIIRDRNVTETQLMSYEIRLSTTSDGNSRQINS